MPNVLCVCFVFGGHLLDADMGNALALSALIFVRLYTDIKQRN